MVNAGDSGIILGFIIAIILILLMGRRRISSSTPEPGDGEPEETTGTTRTRRIRTEPPETEPPETEPPEIPPREPPETTDDFEPRNRWQLIAYLIEKDRDLPESIKDLLFDLLLLHRGSGYDIDSYNFSYVYALRKAFTYPKDSDVENLTNEMLEFIKRENLSLKSDDEVLVLVEFLRSRTNTDREPTKNDIKASKHNNIDMGSTPEDVKATISDLKGVKQLEVDLEKELEDFRHHLSEFEKIYEQNSEVFNAVEGINFTNYSKDSPPSEFYATVKKLDNEVTMDLGNPDNAVHLQNAVEAMAEHLSEMLEELEQMEVDIKKEMGEFTDAEEPLQELELHVENLEALVEILETYTQQ